MQYGNPDGTAVFNHRDRKCYLQTAVNGLGSTAVASVTAAGKISMFCCCPFDALGSTMATYAGQNVGAKKMDRVNTGILTSSIIGSVYSVVILGVMFLWSRQISLLFVDASETVILDQARQMLLINMVFYIPLTLVNVVRFTVQGMGFSKFAILAGVCEMIGRSVVAFSWSVFWLHRSLLRKPGGMDSRRSVSRSGVPVLRKNASFSF